MERLWLNGEQKTLPFGKIKEKAKQYIGDEQFWYTVDQLQTWRNKLLHFHVPVSEGDRFDLKTD